MAARVLLGRPVWVPSPNFRQGRRGRIRVLVIHTAESPESKGSAIGVARWLSRPTTRASAHYILDGRHFLQQVHERDTAWAAPGANHDGIQIELAGRARQTPAEWADAESKLILDRCARLLALLGHQRGIPLVHLTPRDLKDTSRKGVVGHADVTAAFGRSTHTDPGPGFPWASVLAAARRYRAGLS